MKSWRDYWFDLIGMALTINPFGKQCEESIMWIGNKIGGGK